MPKQLRWQALYRLPHKSAIHISEQDMTPAQSHARTNLQVLALGLPRCGTTSMAAILESGPIGMKPVMHAAGTTNDARRADLILEALSATGTENWIRRRAAIQQAFDGYVSSTETLNALADDLMDTYPSAKLILNVRPPSEEPPAIAWARSCKNTIGFFASYWALAACWPLRRYRYWWYRYRLQADVWRQKGIISNRFSFRSKGHEWMDAEFYYRYLEWVQREARKRNRPMLVWHPGMGWEPLCDFLGKAPPNGSTAFPVLNSSRHAKLDQHQCIWRGLLCQILLGLLGATWLWTIGVW